MEQIDIAKVIKDKNPELGRRVPGFIINYLRRILHEGEINEILSKYGHLHGITFIRAALSHMGIEYHANGLENIPADGRYIFASNHPFGGLDGLISAVLVAERFGSVKIIVNDLLMNLNPIRDLFIPVNKHGRQDQESVERVNSAFGSSVPVITFPAGLCSRRINGKVTDVRWKTNFIRKAKQSGRDIVPLFFPGVLSNKFYRLANIRKRLGIKSNLEMLYLPDEMFKQKERSFEVYFGEPISFGDSLLHLTNEQASDFVREKVYLLGDTNDKR